MKIWKYEIPPFVPGAEFTIRKPLGSVVHVAEQGGIGPCMWVIFENETAIADTTFRVYGTGDDIADDCIYVGSWLQAGGLFVWHLFIVDI